MQHRGDGMIAATTAVTVTAISLATTTRSDTISVEWIQLPRGAAGDDATVDTPWLDSTTMTETMTSWLRELPPREAQRIRRCRDPLRQWESLAGWRRMMRLAGGITGGTSGTANGGPGVVWSRDAMGRPRFTRRVLDGDGSREGERVDADDGDADDDDASWEKSWFNLSHDGGCVAIAWDPRRQARLGVDVVHWRKSAVSSLASPPSSSTSPLSPLRWFQEMRGIFTAAERHRIEAAFSLGLSLSSSPSLSSPPTLRSLLAYWAAKESYAKAMGCGLAIDPATIDVAWVDRHSGGGGDYEHGLDDTDYDHTHALLRCAAHPNQRGVTRILAPLPGYLVAVTILVDVVQDDDAAGATATLPQQLDLRLSRLPFDSLLLPS